MESRAVALRCQLCQQLQPWAPVQPWAFLGPQPDGSALQAGEGWALTGLGLSPAEVDDHSPFKFLTAFGISTVITFAESAYF